jgi:hypothetical protein
MVKSRSFSASGLRVMCLWMAAVGCSPVPTDELVGSDAGPSPSTAESGVRVEIQLRLAELDCLDQNDANEFDDEVFVVVSWTGAASGRRQLPGDAGRWRMCGRNEFEPATLLEASMAAGQSMVVSVEVVEDDSQAERVSNQIDDTLAKFDLALRVTETASLEVSATPGSVQDNNAAGLLPLVALDLDSQSRRLGFTTTYRNAAGNVHYAGSVTW